MKIDRALIYYLLKHKELPLQGIGVFKLEGTVSDPAGSDKPLVIPEGAISFTYNPRISEDPELVQFISETTGKILPLASADLDSYITLGKQFINIGKPLVIPNIGMIEKTNSGELIYHGEKHLVERATPPKQPIADVAESLTEEPASFNDFPSQKDNRGRSLLYLLILVILGFTIWAVWKYTFQTDENDSVTQTNVDTSASVTTIASQRSALDSIKSRDSLAEISKVSDTVGFKIVVGIYRTLASGQARIRDMVNNGRNVILYTTDSVNYMVAEPFPHLPMSDTTRIKDSMRRYYGDRNFLIERLP